MRNIIQVACVDREPFIRSSEAAVLRFQTNSGQAAQSRIIGIKEVIRRTNYSKSKIHRDMRTGKFPQQASKVEGSRSAGWFEDDIDRFLEARRREAKYDRDIPTEKTESVSGLDVSKKCELKTNIRSRPALKPHVNKVITHETLSPTGLKFGGFDVYCHAPTLSLVVVVGTMTLDANFGEASH